jgi:ketosteroid isomerase-like protein
MLPARQDWHQKRRKNEMVDVRKVVALVVMAGALALSPAVRAGDSSPESERVVKQFLANWDARNLDAMMTSYTDDSAVLIPQQKPFKGKEQIRTLMKGFVDDFSKPGAVWDTYAVTAEGQIVYILWKAETPANKYPFGSNTFVVKDGKIAYQTIAFSPVSK